jgi:hypothetical protein
MDTFQEAKNGTAKQVKEEPQEVRCQRNFYDKGDTRHTLIFIHGMGQTKTKKNNGCPSRIGNSPYPTEDEDEDYAKLWNMLAVEWKKQNLGLKFIDRFKPLFVDWLYVTDDEQELLYRLAY